MCICACTHLCVYTSGCVHLGVCVYICVSVYCDVLTSGLPRSPPHQPRAHQGRPRPVPTPGQAQPPPPALPEEPPLPGYYGRCSRDLDPNHSFMPIVLELVPRSARQQNTPVAPNPEDARTGQSALFTPPCLPLPAHPRTGCGLRRPLCCPCPLTTGPRLQAL